LGNGILSTTGKARFNFELLLNRHEQEIIFPSSHFLFVVISLPLNQKLVDAIVLTWVSRPQEGNSRHKERKRKRKQ